MHDDELDDENILTLTTVWPDYGSLKTLSMIQDLPNAEEVMQTLSPWEIFASAFINVQDVIKKMELLQFQAAFEDHYSTYLTALKNAKLLTGICRTIKTSKKLKEVMGATLLLLNFMNSGGTVVDQATVDDSTIGFPLHELKQLYIRGGSNQTTSVLGVIVTCLQASKHELLDVEELTVVLSVDFDEICNNVYHSVEKLGEFQKEVEDFLPFASKEADAKPMGRSTKELRAHRSPAHIKTSGRTPMERFLTLAAARLDDIKHQLVNETKFHKETLFYFGAEVYPGTIKKLLMSLKDFFKQYEKLVAQKPKGDDVSS